MSRGQPGIVANNGIGLDEGQPKGNEYSEYTLPE